MFKQTLSLFFILSLVVLDAPQQLADDYKTHVRSVFEDLIDLERTDAEVIAAVTAKINQVLLLDLQFPSMNAAEQLATIFSPVEYGKVATQNLQVMDESTFQSNAALYATTFLPTFDQLSSEYNLGSIQEQSEKAQVLEQIHQAYLEKLKEACNKYVEDLHLLHINQFSSQLDKRTTQIEYFSFQKISSEFIKSLQQTFFKFAKDGRINIKADVPVIVGHFSNTVNQYNKQIFVSAKHLMQVYIDPISNLENTMRYLVYQATANLEVDGSANVDKYMDRITMLMDAITFTFTEQKENGDYDSKAMKSIVSFHQTLNLKFKDLTEMVAARNFQEFRDGLLQVSLKMMLSLATRAEIQEVLSYEIRNEADQSVPGEDIKRIVNAAYLANPFQANVDREYNHDLVRKFRNADILSMIPLDSISDERLSALIHDFRDIMQFDQRYFVVSAKLFLQIYHPMINLDSHEEFYVYLYNMITKFVASFDLESGMDAIEGFDKFLDQAFQQGNDAHMQKYYLFMKLTNLAFVESSVTYTTTFPEFTIGDKMAQYLFVFVNSEPFMNNFLNLKYQEISKDLTSTAINSDQIVTFYSGKTLDAGLFQHVSFLVSQEEHVKKTEQVETKRITFKAKEGRLNKITRDFENKENDKNRLIETVTPKDIQDTLNESIKDMITEPVKVVEKENLVHEVVGRLSSQDLNTLKKYDVQHFINSHDLIETSEGEEISYTFVVVSRHDSPCHPDAHKRC